MTVMLEQCVETCESLPNVASGVHSVKYRSRSDGQRVYVQNCNFDTKIFVTFSDS